MGNLFGQPQPKSTKPKSNNPNVGGGKGGNAPANPQANITSKDRAILDLKNARDRLKKFKKKVHDLKRLWDYSMLIMSF